MTPFKRMSGRIEAVWALQRAAFLPAGGCYVLAVLNNLSHPLVGRLFDASDRQCNTTPKRGFLSQF